MEDKGRGKMRSNDRKPGPPAPLFHARKMTNPGGPGSRKRV